MQYPDTKLIIFVKAPEPGKAKTRLIPALGETGSAELHRRMSQHITNRMLDANICDIELQCYPDSSHPFFMELLAEHCIELNKQQGDNLGERMANALQNALIAYRYAIVIGSDAPAIDADYIHSAIKKLHTDTDLVLGPADDGGYVCLGLSKFHPSLFDNIDWGSSNVLQQTLQRARDSQLKFEQLSPLWDVDTPADLDRISSHPQLSFLLNNLEIRHEPKAQR